ncbi:chaperonin, 10 kDa family protein [Trichomonas vaginalis G3]|uniref:Chaperonin, 10 kDa family protein n=1 Tax=Trichomonas vaginalis (strain ATCC PRA-98 / G3) TaxID=412133 RepID=A2FW67_TRIV3|nr:chaperone cofactor-dependent protein refolding [Trichomonas vaginalis G3]EAX90853.1 chaperonin, 10 kDa family protein [Trichomonas vaginalis G3]KAI5542516.1 chaperone cofactor-dependent protein refolding [Trichomonas vaginalis G3]|eukprot:XP_001303783.1 chaperonin, 10 kDa family protein [Trichomonas vaginalis G3]
MLTSLNTFGLRFSFKGLAPTGSRVIVEMHTLKDGKIGNLYVPDSAKKATNQATVVAVGPGATINGKLYPTTVKPGMKVLLPQFGGQPVKIGKEEYVVIAEEDILGYFE